MNGRQVLLYEYPPQADRERDSNSITREGQFRGPGTAVIVEWIGPPRFYAGGRLIILHLAEDQDTVTLLRNILGLTLSPDAVGSRQTGVLPCENKPGDSSSGIPSRSSSVTSRSTMISSRAGSDTDIVVELALGDADTPDYQVLPFGNPAGFLV